ncbi:transketolase [Candidatus Kuenenbacteria bacterium]|nr:transketolase [Candidatus Kuenenbacteria bacterium]
MEINHNINYSQLEEMAKKLRDNVIEMLYHAGSGHPGGALSSADIITSLYFGEVLKHFPQEPYSLDRDVFILSAGHYCPVLYAALAHSGYFPVPELKTLRKFGSRLLGHPLYKTLPGIENSGGSLGQGISIALGVAKAFTIDNKSNRVYCLMGDGEQEEGQVWEAALFAAHHKLDNLCAIIDVNKIQIDGYTKDVCNTEPLVAKYEAFNWHVIRIDGHDFNQIISAFNEASNTKGKPTVIIADTISGKGLPHLEGTVEIHGKGITTREYDLTRKELI